MDKKIKQVAVYVRKSRDNNESLEGQLSSNLDFCERFNWEYEVFREEGSASSEDWNRPELQRMIKLIEAQHYDAVLVTEQSRITRADEFPKFRNVLQEANCYFITTQTNSIYDYNKPEDEFVSDIMSAVNKQEIAFAKLRLKRGTVQSAKKGNWLGKKSPIGLSYNRDTKRLEPNEDALIIRRIFELYVSGMSTKDIAYKFDFENVTTSINMIWTPAGISRLLNNIVYIGHSLYGRTTQKKVNGKRVTKRTSPDEQILIENTHEPIVDLELWENVQKLKQDRNSRPASLKLGKHKFSGVVRCGTCGNTHSFQSARGKKRLTSCQTRHYSDSVNEYTLCNNQGCYMENFEIVFYALLDKHKKELENYIDLIKSTEVNLSSNNHNDIDVNAKQIKKLQQDIKRVQQGFIMEIFTEEEAQEQIKRFKEQIDVLEKQIAEQKEQNNDTNLEYYEKVLININKFLDGRESMSEREANDILREFCKCIFYVKNEETNMEIELGVVWTVNISREEVTV